MSGIPKIGIDFAGWNVDMFDNDTKIDKLLCSKGWIGFSIYFWLCMKAYGTDGYFYRWRYDDCASTARKMGSGISACTVHETVDYCLQISLFDKGRFDEWGILTSRGIQRRYWCVLQKRRVKKVYCEFWLLEDDECSGLVKVSLKTDVHVAKGYLHDADTHSRPTDRQSKVKESKYNNIVATSERADAADVQKTQDRYSQYKPSTFELWCVDYLIKSLLDDLPNQKVPRTDLERKKWAVHIERMQRIDGLRVEQIRDTLIWTMGNEFWRTNIRSTGKFREKFQTLYLQSQRGGNSRKKNSFSDFKQNDYDFDRLEQELLSN